MPPFATPPLRPARDPEGFYARLGVAPTANAETITAAYRRQARLVHPDVPETGDAVAFMALKQAYDVLIHADSRSAYDRIRPPVAEQEPGEIDPAPYPEMVAPRTRHPRLADLPVAVWAGLASVLAIGVIEVGLHLYSPPTPSRAASIPPTARSVPAPAAGETLPAPYGAAPVRLAGTTNFYIVPTASPAILWRAGDTPNRLVPWGQLPPFSAVQGLRLLKANGLVEVRVTDNANGYIEAGRLTPGDAAAASRAWCTYNAGPPPANGEVLTRGADHGEATLSIDNRSGEPTVVKLRTAAGGLVATMFLEPGGEAAIEGLPAASVAIDFATGEVWSRACHGFAAGMRARRVPGQVAVGSAARLAIPPEGDAPPADLPDGAFERE